MSIAMAPQHYQDQSLGIIIPMFNEAAHIEIVLQRISSITIPDWIKSYEIIVVDDCSSDESVPKVKAWIANHPHFRLIQHEHNKGKGAAVRTGIEASDCDMFLIQDADLELLPSDIPSMLHAMRLLGVEFVNGSRYLPGVLRPISSYKRYMINRLFTFFTSVLLDVKLTDMACGYKLFHRNLVSKIQLRENRFGFEAELIIKAMRIKRNNIVEVPVHYFPRNLGGGKKLKNSDGFKILWTIVKYGLMRLS